MSALERLADGVRVRVRVTPRADRDAVGGPIPTAAGPAFALRVRAVPDQGKANEAVRRLLAETLEMPISAVRIESGATSRVKTIHVAGDAERLATRLEDIG